MQGFNSPKVLFLLINARARGENMLAAKKYLTGIAVHRTKTAGVRKPYI